MQSLDSTVRNLAARSAWTANFRFERRYAEYPHYAVLLACAMALLAHLPVGTGIMPVVSHSPLGLALLGALWVGGAVLAAALAVIGVWRPGRANFVLSLLALGLCSSPWM
jgi:hypothetical protein